MTSNKHSNSVNSVKTLAYFNMMPKFEIDRQKISVATSLSVVWHCWGNICSIPWDIIPLIWLGFQQMKLLLNQM